MGIAAFFRQHLPLAHSETVLLVRDHQGQIFEMHFLLDHRMSTHHQIGFPGGDLFVGIPLFLSRHAAHQKQRPQRCMILFHILTDTFVMLSCQHLRGRHHGSLETVGGTHEQSQHRDDGFAGTHVPLYQPVHGPAGGQVGANILNGPPLGPGETEGQLLQKGRQVRIPPGRAGQLVPPAPQPPEADRQQK